MSYAPVLMLGQDDFINNTGSSLRVCKYVTSSESRPTQTMSAIITN